MTHLDYPLTAYPAILSLPVLLQCKRGTQDNTTDGMGGGVTSSSRKTKQQEQEEPNQHFVYGHGVHECLSATRSHLIVIVTVGIFSIRFSHFCTPFLHPFRHESFTTIDQSNNQLPFPFQPINIVFVSHR